MDYLLPAMFRRQRHRRPYRRRKSQSSPTPRPASQPDVGPAFEREELGTVQNGDKKSHYQTNPYANLSGVVGEGSITRFRRLEDPFIKGREQRNFLGARVDSPFFDCTQRFTASPVEHPAGLPEPLDPFAGEFRPSRRFSSNPSSSNVKIHKVPSRSCAFKVGNSEIFGNPFVPNDDAQALFSAYALPNAMPCLRLEIGFNQVLDEPYDGILTSRIENGSRKAYFIVNSSNIGPSFQRFFPPTVRWCTRHVIDLGYRRAVQYPGDLNDDAEVIQLCPEGPEKRLEHRPMERLISMTWVSTSPHVWRYNDERTKKMLAPPVRASLDALENKRQPEEITIWFLNPWGLDATDLEWLVQASS